MRPNSNTLAQVLLLSATPTIQANYLDQIGYTDLIAQDPSLSGTGIRVAQVEAPLNGNQWQSNPAYAGISSSKFTYFDRTNPFPTGSAFQSQLESADANIVAARFYADPSGTANQQGIAPGLSAIDVYEAGYFFDNLIMAATDTNSSIVNQSFIFDRVIIFKDRAYDDYAATHNVLFINGINTNQTPATIPTPGSSYNGITVGTPNASVTSLSDGRSKPDIVAPGSERSSFTVPLVSGSAALLQQAGARGDGGADTTNSATDIRTLKALLLNGATKPSNWSQTNTRPLDRNLGAGILNIDRSYQQLQGGMHAPTETQHIKSDSSTTPSSSIPTRISSLSGWNLATITTTNADELNPDNLDGLHHYHFTLDAAANYSLNATLSWNRQAGKATINNLNLRLYNTTHSTPVAASISPIDNVEHLHLTQLPAGDYILQVHSEHANSVSNDEDYALAFHFQALPPTAPSNFTASPAGLSQLNLHWSDNASDENNYILQRSPADAENYSTIATLPANTTSYTDTNRASATRYDYQLYASSAIGDSSAITTSATTHPTLEDWRLIHFGTDLNNGNAANTADLDADQINNLLEYALGGDPTSPDRSILPRQTLTQEQNERYLELSFSRPSGTNGLTYTVHTTTDLSNWPNDNSGVNSPSIINHNNGTETWTYRRTAPLEESERAFMRLTISN